MIDLLFLAIEKHLQITKEQILGRNRLHSIVRARMFIAYVLRNYQKASLQDIGKVLGGKDHSTILHYLESVENAIECEKITNKHSFTEMIINKILNELRVTNEL